MLFDDPVKFFKKKKENFRKEAAYLISLSLFFVIMNELSVRFGFVKYQSVLGPFESIIINFVSIIFVFLILVLIIYSFSRFKSMNKAFFVLTYSAIPLLLLAWVPFIIIKVFGLIWSAVVLSVGLVIKMGLDYRRSAILTIMIITMIVIMALITQNYILTPIPLE